MKSINLPNSLTILRIGLIPVFNYLYLKGSYGAALIIFSLAGVTDFFDGMIARLCHSRTSLGAILDPIADKALMTATFIVLTVAGRIPMWLTVLVISKDLYITGGVFFLKWKNRPLPVKPTLLSKTNTGFELLILLLVFIYSYIESVRPLSLGFRIDYHLAINFCAYLIACMTFLTAIQYTMIGWKIFNGSNEYADLSAKKNQTGSE